MSRISEHLASQIARKLTEGSKQAVKELLLEYEQLVTDLYEEQMPDEIKKNFAKYPDWFHTRNSVHFSGHGFQWENVKTTRPVIQNTNSYPTLHLTAKIASQIITAKRKWEKAKEAAEKLERETKQALINLRTYKNIQENIPAAKPFLPPPMSNALVVNVDSLNKKLQAQPPAKVEKQSV